MIGADQSSRPDVATCLRPNHALDPGRGRSRSKAIMAHSYALADRMRRNGVTARLPPLPNESGPTVGRTAPKLQTLVLLRALVSSILRFALVAKFTRRGLRISLVVVSRRPIRAVLAEMPRVMRDALLFAIFHAVLPFVGQHRKCARRRARLNTCNKLQVSVASLEMQFSGVTDPCTPSDYAGRRGE
jgi:hypothetical protein